jgi:hypothetical protein
MTDKKRERKRHAMSITRVQGMLKRVEKDLDRSDKEPDEGKKLTVDQRTKLYSLAQKYMQMLIRHDKNKALVEAAAIIAGKKNRYGMA